MEEITMEADHGRVKAHHIVEAEKDVYTTLRFKLYSPTLYEEAANDLLLTFQTSNDLTLSKKEHKPLLDSLAFICKALFHDYDLSNLPIEDQKNLVLS